VVIGSRFQTKLTRPVENRGGRQVQTLFLEGILEDRTIWRNMGPDIPCRYGTKKI